MALTLDHIPFAWHDLDEVTTEFARLGLTPEYGGRHDNGVTHMAVVGFPDQSYIECIAEHTEGDHDFWPTHIRTNAGPAAWCIRVSDIIAETKRVLTAGYPVRGPLSGARERDDGTLVEWDRAEFGTPAQRLLFPFAIQDRTPLSHRISTSPSVATGPLTGIGQVVIAVQDVKGAIKLFRNLYRFPRPVWESVPGFGRVASFPGQPVALVTAEDATWLADRLDQYPAGPCACLLATDDLDSACVEYPLQEPIEWPDGRLAVFDSDIFGVRLGVVERP